MFRTLHDEGGTLLLDEAERLSDSTPDIGELRSMLLAGYKRGGRATRLERVGDTFKRTEFEVYGPKAVACMSALPPALASRCIPIRMFKAPRDAPQPKQRIDANPQGWQALRDDLCALAMEHGKVWLVLAQDASACPDMSGRDYELWQPLLALAKWIEAAGLKGLAETVRRHALDCTESAQEDRVPDTDEILLQEAAKMARSGTVVSPGQVLVMARGVADDLFRHWNPQMVSRRLRQYGFPRTRRTTHGLYVFDGVPLALLAQIQGSYGIDLGVSSPSTLSSPVEAANAATPLP